MILHNFCWLLQKALASGLKSSVLILLGNVEGGPQLKADVRQGALILNLQLNLPDTLLVSWCPTLGPGNTSHHICSENGTGPCCKSQRFSFCCSFFVSSVQA